MTFFDPKYFCKQNLKEKDKLFLDFVEATALTAIDRAETTYEDDYAVNGDMLDKIRLDVVKQFVEVVKTELGEVLQEHVVGIIDHYKEDITPVDSPETYDYEAPELPFQDPEDKT